MHHTFEKGTTPAHTALSVRHFPLNKQITSLDLIPYMSQRTTPGFFLRLKVVCEGNVSVNEDKASGRMALTVVKEELVSHFCW